MRSRIALEMARKSARNAALSAFGAGRSVAPMASAITAAVQGAALAHQPVDAADEQLTDGAGAFLFLAGYSAIGGPDVLA